MLCFTSPYLTPHMYLQLEYIENPSNTQISAVFQPSFEYAFYFQSLHVYLFILMFVLL